MDNRRSVPTEENAAGILLIPSTRPYTSDELPIPATGRTVVCDFPLLDSMKGLAMPWGYELQTCDVVDHHAEDHRWYQKVTSTSLAVEYVRLRGLADHVILNHADCDSILAALILRGHLPPDDQFVQASIAADHTGEANEIADLLQSMEDERSLAMSIATLDRWLETGDLPEGVRRLVSKREVERRRAAEAGQDARFEGRIAVVVGSESLDAAFLPALPQNPWLVLYAFTATTSPGQGDQRLFVKVRLSPSAPSGFTLHGLGLKEIICGYGGRWNAGSNVRGGGTKQDLEAIVKQMSETLSRLEEDRLLSRAIAIAAEAHVGQFDKGGDPYILHPLRLMAKQKTYLARIVAVLHDVVEDGPGWTFERLADEGFPEEVLAPLRLLTQEPDVDYKVEATYLARINEIIKDPIARAVKLADVEDNLDISRLAEVTEKDRVRLNKYKAALRILVENGD